MKENVLNFKKDTDSLKENEKCCGECDTIKVTDDEIIDFLDFIKNKEEYLNTGLGAFHTDNHSNW